MLFITLAFVLLLGSSHLCMAQKWTPIPTMPGANPLQQIAVDDCNPNIIIGSTSNTIFQSFDGGQSWEKSFSIPDESMSIKRIIYKPGLENSVFCATNTGIYKQNALDAPWDQCIKISRDEEILTFTINPFDTSEVFIGTTNGLYRYKNVRGIFTKQEHYLKNYAITALDFHPNIQDLLFISTSRAFFTFRLYDRQPAQSHVFTDSHSIEEAEFTKDFISFFPFDDMKVVLIHHGILFVSTDLGKTMTQIDKTNYYKNALPLSRSSYIIGATNRSVISIDPREKKIHSFDAGLFSSTIYDIALHDFLHTVLFATTDRGIFRLDSPAFYPEKTHIPVSLTPQTEALFQQYIMNDPPISFVHAAAIEYANVHNSKTRSWHRNARLRALIPSVSVGVTTDSKNSVDIDRGSTTNEDVYIIGPDEESFSWGLDLEWDLANLFWNDDETAIDYREKYMIEMREDILNEINSLYYERRRKQFVAITASDMPLHEKCMLHLEIDECTARIDALTGGAFSREMNKQ
jgi:hypothetical protein